MGESKNDYAGDPGGDLGGDLAGDTPPTLPAFDVAGGGGAGELDQSPPSLPYRFVNARGVVTQPVACRSCGYNLLSFSLAQVCPECGWAVSQSVQGADLFHSPPGYLRTLRSSMLIILAALLVDVSAVFAFVIMEIVNDNFGMRWNLLPLHIASEAASFLANVVTVWGFWRFTTADPTLTRQEHRTSAYWVLRVATIAAALSSFIDGMYLVLTTAGVHAFTGFVGTAINALSIFGYVLVAAWISAAMYFISTIARRVPDLTLARHAKTMVWLSWVLMFPGMLACFAGPIACVVYFFIALVRMRAHIGRVLAAQEGASGAGSAAIA